MQVDCHSDWLDAAESERLSKLLAPKMTQRFCATRSALRQLLASYQACRPEDIRLAIGKDGKPHLLNDPALHFNISHSQDTALFAFSRDFAVGIDVETERHMPQWRQIARRVFDPDTIQAIAASENPERHFFRAWTTFEARQKCLGRGIFSAPVDQNSVHARQFSVSIGQFGSVAWGNNDAVPSISFKHFKMSSNRR